jgi:hypothetical protein
MKFWVRALLLVSLVGFGGLAVSVESGRGDLAERIFAPVFFISFGFFLLCVFVHQAITGICFWHTVRNLSWWTGAASRTCYIDRKRQPYRYWLYWMLVSLVPLAAILLGIWHLIK